MTTWLPLIASAPWLVGLVYFLRRFDWHEDSASTAEQARRRLSVR